MRMTRSLSSASPTSWPSSSPPSVARDAEGGSGGALSDHPRFLNAGNAGPFTLDGTRTYLVGSRRVVVIDPGPEGAQHVAALSAAVRDAADVQVVVTHGHRDHAPAASALAEDLGVDVQGPEGTVGRPATPTRLGPVHRRGDLVAIDTPGHARHHLAFHWPTRQAVFAGDLVLGRGSTTWVGEYPGCVADYLSSLERLRGLDLAVIYPAHGDPLNDPKDAIDRYASHRLDRIRQVEEALRRQPDIDERELLSIVYGGGVPGALQEAALRSVRALMEHVGYARS